VEAGDRDDSFLTVAQVAETLQLNQQTVRNWIDQGSLPALRVGRRVRIRRSDFDKLVEDGYSGAGGGAESIEPIGPNADDFWGGEPVGLPDARAGEQEPEGSAEHLNRDGVGRNGEPRGSESGSAEHLDHQGGG
jgi:excisionase family DNA binding protein